MLTLRLAVAVLGLWALPALADGEHCHVTSPEGDIFDEPSAPTFESCRKIGGIWKNHAPHCHVEGDGRTMDYPAAQSISECTKVGGRWFAHGHDKH